MESVIIDQWIKNSGDGYGSGYGSGSGSGSGYGYGFGDGSGDGYGFGDGEGYGDGSGDGSGIRIVRYGNQKVYDIDGIPTIVYCIKGNYAKGSSCFARVSKREVSTSAKIFIDGTIY